MTLKHYKTVYTVTLAVILLVSLSNITPAYAKSFWDVLFGAEEVKPEIPPEKSLQAPFGKVNIPNGMDKNDPLLNSYGKSNYYTSTENVKNMTQPNASPAAIANWSSEVIAEALTISPDTFEQSSKKLENKFIPYAMQEYKKYIEDSKLIPTLKQNNMTINAMAIGPGVLGREGALSGAYHWVVKVPILVTYYNKNTKSINKSSNIQSQKLSVEVQVGRVFPEKPDDNGIRVEHWRVYNEQ